MSHSHHHSSHSFNLIEGDLYPNLLHGTHHNDKMIGRGGNDALFGNGGDDVIYGDHDTPIPHHYTASYYGNDFLSGGDGKDTLFGGLGDDFLDGGKGNDKLYGEQGDDFLFGGKDHDTLYGGKGDDFLDGGKGNDKLFGGKGDDALFGGKGNDKLYGGKGNDRLNGFGTSPDHHSQFDTLYGEQGSDTFILGGKNWGVSYFEEGDGYATIKDWDPRHGRHDHEYDQIEVYDAYYHEGGHAPHHAPHGHSQYHKGYSLKFTFSHGIGSSHEKDTEIYFTNQHGQTDRIGIVADSTNVNILRDFVFV